MKKYLFRLLVLSLCLTISASYLKAEVSIGVKADEDGIKSFYLAVGEQYKVPEREVIIVRERNIPNDELPVVFFIASRASVAPDAVVKLRLTGKSWMEITLHFGLSPAIYYVAFDKDPGPPYGKAWGHYKNKKKEEWKTIRLADDDIVNFVNVKFMCERHGYTPAQVISIRSKGESYVLVNTNIKKQKEGKVKQHADSDNPGKGKTSGKGKNK
jgi:hypothetical protein